jgi:hypothetical protein
MLTEGIRPRVKINVPSDAFVLVGFEVTLYGRFWVTPEDHKEARVEAHIFLCVLAYHLLVSIGKTTKTHLPSQSEAVFIGGNGLRPVGAIHALEETLCGPVLTANQIILWQALRRVAITPR